MEEHIIGDFIFGDSTAQHNPTSNRSLLMELCAARKLVIGNTWYNEPPHRQVTCYNVGSSPTGNITPKDFGQIDFCLISRTWTHIMNRIWSDINIPLASHHFSYELNYNL